jgi:hypothetical protein
MPHEIRPVLQAFASWPWFIEPRKAAEIVGMLELRAKLGPRREPYRPVVGFDQEDERSVRADQPSPSTSPGSISVLRLYGTIVHRMERLGGCVPDRRLADPFRPRLRCGGRGPQRQGDRHRRGLAGRYGRPGARDSRPDPQGQPRRPPDRRCGQHHCSISRLLDRLRCG